LKLPLEVGGGLIIAPGAICFDDTEFYQKYSVNIKLHVLENACLVAEYFFRNIKFDDKNYGDWRREDHVFVAGISLKI
jgi:hypothetical protein